ncbi:DUF5024 domain-containing protein [Dysgonomonas sp. Marseille-P4677]|uniref:DUF5024 domain-containing protein n=1 Tax=Dysgonomonas sp. Marseille-P4677 TaxID=2364790 RepID=UPI001912E024|nr:DUF5024 domain-containing protein [Dysgonomonas sp. Marseille-P4677]MBK5722222.1 DUF5024 domain-containing protein [Dysgonomonas sp. Marseille-P4677]
MKRLLIFIFMFLFTLLGAGAQSNIDKVLKEGEQNGNLTKSIVYQPEKKRKAPVYSTIMYIKDDSCLVNKFIRAFEKDQPKASMSMVSQATKGEKIISEMLVFYSQGEQKTYSYEITDGSNAKITYIKNKVEEPEKKIDLASSVRKSDTQKMKILIPKNGYVNINGKKMTAEEARKIGFDVQTIPNK